jgi:hypothetical protein
MILVGSSCTLKRFAGRRSSRLMEPDRILGQFGSIHGIHLARSTSAYLERRCPSLGPARECLSMWRRTSFSRQTSSRQRRMRRNFRDVVTQCAADFASGAARRVPRFLLIDRH